MARVKEKEARTNGARAHAHANEDVGNIVFLEHVNVTIPDQLISTTFYILGMGFTRDPYMMVGLNNMWVNIGEQQFHEPTRDPQVIPGHIGVVVPDLDALARRLESVKEALAHTKFRYSVEDGYVSATCPWGNELRCYLPHPRFGDMVLGVPYVELQARPGTAAGIARFYKQIMRTPATVEKSDQGAAARVHIGTHQWLSFRETEGPIAPYDGHHIAVYVANFSEPFADLEARDLIMEAVLNHQFRFKEIVDPKSGEHLHTLEHEVRSMYHPMYRRNLVNRNAGQEIRRYVRGHDAMIPVGG